MTGFAAHFQSHAAMLDAAACIREEGIKTAVLTNNFWLDKSRTKSALPVDHSQFDVVSCILRYAVNIFVEYF